jgi:type IV pilus assembly protein PilC
VRGARRIRLVELPAFTLRLSAMLDAGLPLIQCMEALSEQTTNLEFRRIVREIGARIEAGDSFAEALSGYRVLFGDLYVSMIRTGEVGGALAEVMSQLGAYLEASQALRRKVKSALTYPVMVMGLSLVLTAFMILYIVPRFKQIYADFGALDKLPKPTVVLLSISDFVGRNVLLVLAVIVVLVLVLHQLKKTERGALLYARYILKLPVAGPLIEKIALSRMCRTFATLLRSGVPLLRTLEIVGEASGNKYVASWLLNAGREIEAGGALAESFKKWGHFPPMLLHMLSAGEKTGNVDGMLMKVADFYDDEVTNALDALSSMIEPLLMAFLGVVVGGIVICMYMPIFKLSTIVNV